MPTGGIGFCKDPLPLALTSTLIMAGPERVRHITLSYSSTRWVGLREFRELGSFGS